MYSLTEKNPLIYRCLYEFPDLAGILPPIIQCHKINSHLEQSQI